MGGGGTGPGSSSPQRRTKPGSSTLPLSGEHPGGKVGGLRPDGRSPGNPGQRPSPRGEGAMLTHLFLRCLTSFFLSRSRSCLARRITSEASSMELAGLPPKAGAPGHAPSE